MGVVIEACVKHPGGRTRKKGTDNIYCRYKFVAVSLPKRFRNGRLTSGTAVRRFKKCNRHLDPEVLKKKSI
jgi:hypothetical protein